MRVIHHIFAQKLTKQGLLVLGFGLFVALGGGFFVNGAFAADGAAHNDQRLVTIYDGENEISIVTRARTIGDALQQADVEVGELDTVEPVATEELRAKSYQVNVFRARPVTVVDETKTQRIVTASQSVKQIAADAGVVLYDEDETALTRSNDPLQGTGLVMTIDRATNIVMNQYGKTFDTRTQAATVAGLLREKGIVLGEKDGVTPDLTTPITAQMVVKVWRDGVQTFTQEETIPMKVDEIKDATIDYGVRQVKTEGSNGKKNVTYEIEIRGGVEVSRKEIASVIILEPVKEVVVVGTKSKTYTGSHADWMAAAGIAEADYYYVEKLIQKESTWNPSAVNSSSGACGLVQALPCSKLGPEWSDPVVALRWGQNYVNNRYGGWAGAWNHSVARGWY